MNDSTTKPIERIDPADTTPPAEFLVCATPDQVPEPERHPDGVVRPCTDCSKDLLAPPEEAQLAVPVCSACATKRLEAAKEAGQDDMYFALTSEAETIMARAAAERVIHNVIDSLRERMAASKAATDAIDATDIAAGIAALTAPALAATDHPAVGSKEWHSFIAGVKAGGCAALVAFKVENRDGGRLAGLADEAMIMLCDIVSDSQTELLKQYGADPDGEPLQ